MQQGGSALWSALARLAIILGIFTLWRSFAITYIPQAMVVFGMLLGDPSIPPYHIAATHEGAQIEFRGGPRSGASTALAKVLEENPQALVLEIESPGGRVMEGVKIADLVTEHGMKTYCSDVCASAATLILIAGQERVVTQNARVGFHTGFLVGATAEQKRDIDDIYSSRFRNAGVSEAFIKHLLATRPPDMWYPSFSEMMAADVITSQSTRSRGLDLK